MNIDSDPERNTISVTDLSDEEFHAFMDEIRMTRDFMRGLDGK